MELKDKIRELIVQNEKNELRGLEDMYAIHAKAADLDEESSLGSEDFAQQDQAREAATGIEIRINQAKLALNVFRGLNHDKKDEVTPGALVLTDSLNFYIGISASLFEYEGKNYIGLEQNAPFYAELQGAKAGDEVVYIDNKYKILEIL